MIYQLYLVISFNDLIKNLINLSNDKKAPTEIESTRTSIIFERQLLYFIKNIDEMKMLLL